MLFSNEIKGGKNKKKCIQLDLFITKKILLVCFLLRLKRDKNVSHLQAISSIWRPLSPWGPLDFLSTYLGNDSLTTMLLCPWNFPGKSTRVGCHFLLQRIFPTQGSNPGLLYCRQTLYRLSSGKWETTGG